MNPWLIAAPAIGTGLVGLTAYGAVHPRSQWFGPTLHHTHSARRLALTFDDGPNPAITPKLLELLARYQAKATFFLIGKYVRESPSLVQEIATCGHLIGNHTDSHPNLFFCGPAETRVELLRCSDFLAEVLLTEPRWFRPPFGIRSPWLSEIVHAQRMQMVMWSLLPGDWRARSPGWLVSRMHSITDHARQSLAAMGQDQPARPGDILCLHDGDYARPNADRGCTVAALKHCLPLWRDAGLEFVTIGQDSGKVVEA